MSFLAPPPGEEGLELAGLLVMPARLIYMRSMVRRSVVLVADRSRLAADLLRLLISTMGAALIARRSLRDAIAGLRRGMRVDLMIVSTNSMGPRPEESLPALGLEAAARVRKIFLCTDSRSDRALAKSLGELQNSRIMSRPFEPAELAGVIQGVIGGAGSDA